MGMNRPKYVALTYVLELDGKLAGRFFRFSGGDASADVVREKVGGGATSRKHLGSVKYGDIALDCGTGMSRTFYDWVGSAFDGKTTRRSGALIGLDPSSKPKARLDFSSALVKSLALPALDRSAKKEEAFMTVTISPERTSFADSSGPQNLGVYASALPKAWNVGSFRIQIDGLSKECSHVTYISSLKLGQKITEDSAGEAREPALVQTAIEFSNITLKLPGSFAAGFNKWADDSIVKGDTLEKDGSIDFFAPGSSSSYFSVKLSGLGIFGMTYPPGGRTNTALPVTVNLYCEGMSFSAGAAAIK